MISWTRRPAPKGPPVDYLVSGKVAIGSVFWNLSGGDTGKAYRWKLNLPGRTMEGTAPDVLAGKNAAERAFFDWCAAAALKMEE